MQKNLSCKTLEESRKNILCGSILFVPLNLILLFLGALIVLFYTKNSVPIPIDGDALLYDFVVKNSGICHQINFNLEENFNNITSIKILNPDIINLFKESTKTYINDASNITKQYAIIYDILTKLDHETHKSSIFRNAQQLIQQELSNPKLDNAYIADKLNISEVYLRKLFNKNLNTSPRQYIIKTRMEKALSLLVNDYSISKIAGIVGYESVFSFSRAFKDYYKESPVKYFKKYT